MPIGNKRPRTLSADMGMSRSNIRRSAPGSSESSDSTQSGNRVELSFNTSNISGNATVQNAGGNIFNGDYTVHQKRSTDELDREVSLDTSTRVKGIQQVLDKRKIQQWIYSADWDTSSNYNAAHKVHLPGTGSWFLGGSKFAQWKAQPGSVLWLEGGPGSGKTVLSCVFSLDICGTMLNVTLLSSSAIKEIIDFCDLKPLVRGYAYFFFDARNGNLQHLAHENFIRSLISQLSDRCGDNIPTALVSLYNTCDQGHRQPDHISLEDTLLRVLECFEDTYIVIDSLDECAERVDLLKWIRSVALSKTLEKLHLMVTSRSESEIQQGLMSLSRLEKVSIMDQSMASDIYAYINAALAKSNKWDDIEKKMIKDAIFPRSGGMFRWVAMQLHDVMKCRNKKQLIQQLSSLPKDLNTIYERIFERSDHPEDVQKFLQWLAFSKRDMTVTEIDEVGTVDLSAADGPLYDPDMRSREPGTVLTICYGLVTEINGTVKLAHLSVKEYLIERMRSNAEAQRSTSERISHSVIAQTCLAHLLYFNREGILDGESPGYISLAHSSSFPLARYAAEHWVSHYHSAHADCSRLSKLLLDLFALPRSRALINWVRLHRPDPVTMTTGQSVETIASPLYYACLVGLTQTVQHLINNGADVNATGGKHITPLLACISRQGHGDVALLLLENGADVNALCGRPLQRASGKGDLKLVKLLLEKGADVNAALDESELDHFVPLFMVLDKGEDANAGRIPSTALQAACTGGYVELAKLLLQSGANVNAAGGYHDTALIAASKYGHFELVELLLDHGADVNFVGKRWGRSALDAASRHPDVAKLLRERGAIDSQEDEYDST